MNISVFETEHFEGAFPVIRLFDMPGNEITIYTSPETHKRFIDLFQSEAGRYKWTILPGNSKLRFFFSFYKNLRKHQPDILYINTISNNHILYALVLCLLPIKKVVLTVHDINCLFESRPSRNFRQAIIHWGKKWLTKQVDEFNVVSDTMTTYLRTKTKGKPTHIIPGAVYEHKQSSQVINEALQIVVPGSLDRRRRDYEQVFALAATADKEKLPLRIILLGGFSDDYGESITSRASAFESLYCEIICYYTRIVDQDEFDKQMDTAHFVFIPSVIATKICGDIPETYGISKSSGNMFDVIKHAKPFIVPEGLTISPYLQASCFKYGNINDITDFLKNFMSSPGDYITWQEKAAASSLNYTIKKVRERNASLFDEKGQNTDDSD